MDLRSKIGDTSAKRKNKKNAAVVNNEDAPWRIVAWEDMRTGAATGS